MELTEILEAIGYSGDAENITREDLVKHINSRFVNRDRAFEDEQVRKQAFGRVFGEVAGKVAKLTGKSKSEVQEMGNDAAFELLEQTFEQTNAKLQEVQAKAKEGQTKQLGDLQAKIEDYEKSIESYREGIAKAQAAAEEANKKYETGIHEYKVGMAKKDLFGSLPWAESANEFVRKGIEATFAEKYRLDLEDDQPVIKTAEGKLIEDPKKAGSFLDPKTVLTQLAEQAQALKNNNAEPGGPKPGPTTVAKPQGNVPDWVAQRQQQTASAVRPKVVR